MPFLISTQTLSQGWEDAQLLARIIKAGAEAQKAASLAGPVVGSRILKYEEDLRAHKARLQAIAALPNIAAYVSSLPDTPVGYVVATEFNAMVAQIDATVNWIRTNFPRSSGGTQYLLERTWGADGPVERTFSTADLAGYRTQLDALLVSIG